MTAASSTPPVPMLNVRFLAHELGVQPVDLERELVADGIKVLAVSKRGRRVAAPDWQRWREQREQRCAAEFQQRDRRADYVRNGDEQPKRRAAFRR